MLALKDSQAFSSGTALSYNQYTISMINYMSHGLLSNKIFYRGFEPHLEINCHSACLFPNDNEVSLVFQC